MSSILVAYFSQPDPARPQGDADTGQPATGLLVDRNLVGNVQYMAQAIAYETGADLFRIKAKKLYPASYAMTVAIAQGQKQANERPELDETIEDFDKYDTVFLGYPIWWMDLPMPVYSFLARPSSRSCRTAATDRQTPWHRSKKPPRARPSRKTSWRSPAAAR